MKPFLFSIGLFVVSAHSAIIVQFTSANSDWQSIYNGFTTQESFETTTLQNGLSITLEGGAFAAAQSYTSLPSLFNPSNIPGGLFGGPEPDNAWAGQNMVTNFAYQAGLPSGSNWSNQWDGTVYDAAAKMSFNFGEHATSVGIGLSNFQSLVSTGDSYFPITDHRLYINGVAMAPTLESLAGSNWFPSTNHKNAYLTITATEGDVITSIGFEDISPVWGSMNDALNFDALGYTTASTPAAVPEPGSMALMGLGFGALIFMDRKRKGNWTAKPRS